MKKASWLVLLLSFVALGAGKTARAQIAIYGAATADRLNSGPYTDFLEGGTAGVLAEVGKGWHNRLTLSADLQGNFVYDSSTPHSTSAFYTKDEMYDAITIGPRISLAPHFFKLAPYIQMNLGFARYHDPNTRSTTDNVLGGEAGVTRQLTSRFDAVVDYSYSHFSYNSGFYNPQTFSVGAMYHFTKR